VWIGGFNTFVLLTSSLSAVLAHQAAEHGDGKKAANLLYATCGGALTFICVKAFEWTDRDRPRLHALVEHLLVVLLHRRGDPRAARDRGRIIMLIVAADAKKNLELHRVELIGIYWHFVDVVWIFLFPLLYIAK
jgi:heme/copper-type cytochrome/quinol oxidase subunit 3